ncbi:hypothetical protein HIR70_09565, partial [Pasteurella multocida]|nr:hypothetical protein [Pasteurella multocida]NMR62992.1 hypothetical protein [Pasteurella multocida]
EEKEEKIIRGNIKGNAEEEVTEEEIIKVSKISLERIDWKDLNLVFLDEKKENKVGKCRLR